MDGMKLLLLYMTEKINGERTLAGCYHILTGKKSAQAIQDASLFGFSAWFGLFPEWKRSSFENIVSDFVVCGQLKWKNDSYILSLQEKGKLNKELESYQFFKRAFLLQHTSITVQEILIFSKKFHLLSQVLSHFLHDNKNYYPTITDIDIQLGLKQCWKSIKDKQGFAKSFVTEMYSFLEQLEDDLLSAMLLDRLSGHQVNGRTFQQMAKSYGIPEAILRIYYFQSMGCLLHSIREQHSSVLKELVTNEHSISSKLTLSAQSTYQLLEKGVQVEEIGRIRNLKISTIEDHIMEIALHSPNFDVSPFISEEVLEEVLQLSKQMETKKLRRLKEKLNDHVSYFQIRLALVLDKNRLERVIVHEQARD